VEQHLADLEALLLFGDCDQLVEPARIATERELLYWLSSSFGTERTGPITGSISTSPIPGDCQIAEDSTACLWH